MGALPALFALGKLDIVLRAPNFVYTLVRQGTHVHGVFGCFFFGAWSIYGPIRVLDDVRTQLRVVLAGFVCYIFHLKVRELRARTGSFGSRAHRCRAVERRRQGGVGWR